MGLFRRLKWEILSVNRGEVYTRIIAKHMKTGKIVEMLRAPNYAPRADELRRSLEMELENLLESLYAEWRRRTLDELGGKKI